MAESDNFASPRAIQFIAPNDHKFELNLKELKQIFKVNIRDHYVVVVPIAGALRTGKSFLLNYFLKYLNAQQIGNGQMKNGCSKDYVGDILEENNDQSPDMQTLRTNIKGSFNEIEAGTRVAEEENFKGCSAEIRPKFLEHVDNLVKSIFEPSNLIVKRVNGKNITAGQFLVYLETCVKAISGDQINAQTIYAANVDYQIRIIHENCSKVYKNEMENAFYVPEEYFTDDELNQKHEHANKASLSAFQEKPKLGSESLVVEWEEKLKTTNQDSYDQYKVKNEYRRLKCSPIWKTICKSSNRVITTVQSKMTLPLTLTAVGSLLAVVGTFLLETATYTAIGACSITIALVKRMLA